MERRFILGILIFLSILVIGCNKVENGINKEIIIIDEVANETVNKEKDLEISLLYRVENKSEEKDDNILVSYEVIEDKVYEFKTKVKRMKMQSGIEGYEIISIKVANLEEVSSTGLNSNKLKEISISSLNFKDLNIEGELLAGANRIMIRNERMIYYLNDEDELKEISEYQNLDRKTIDKLLYQESIRNKDINVIDINYLRAVGDGIKYEGDFDSVEKVLIDYKNNRYLELKKIYVDEEFERSGYKILDWIDNRVYISTVRQKAHEISLVLGYIENNIFYEIFEDKGIKIIEPNINYNYAYGNKVQIIENKIIFAGIIDEVNGIWTYNMEDKNLSLQIEFERNMTTSFYLNEDNNFIYIDSDKFENSLLSNTSNVIGKVDKDLKITETISLFNNKADNEESRYLKGISKSGDRVYFNFNVESKNYFEVYEIMD